MIENFIAFVAGTTLLMSIIILVCYLEKYISPFAGISDEAWDAFFERRKRENEKNTKCFRCENFKEKK